MKQKKFVEDEVDDENAVLRRLPAVLEHFGLNLHDASLLSRPA